MGITHIYMTHHFPSLLQAISNIVTYKIYAPLFHVPEKLQPIAFNSHISHFIVRL